jgi:uncharacterized protein (TIGR00725 family)
MYQICVSGAARGKSVERGKKLAAEVGRAIAHGGHTLMTGATTGLPYYAAKAYKDAGGKMSVGVSPAATKIEHIMKYRLPVAPYDTILYSGLHYIGRDALLITSSDGVVTIGGRLGTLHEFAIAVESQTPIAVIQGAGGESDQIQEILKVAGREPNMDIIVGTDPDELVSKLINAVDQDHKKYTDLYH